MTIRDNQFQSKPHIYMDNGLYVFHLCFTKVTGRTAVDARIGWVYTDSSQRGLPVELSLALLKSREKHGKVRIA